MQTGADQGCLDLTPTVTAAEVGDSEELRETLPKGFFFVDVVSTEPQGQPPPTAA